MKHREANLYYLRLLNREPPPVARMSLVDDTAMLDAMDDKPAKRARVVSAHVQVRPIPGCLALMDEVPSEGEPEDPPEDGEVDPEKNESIS